MDTTSRTTRLIAFTAIALVTFTLMESAATIADPLQPVAKAQSSRVAVVAVGRS